MDNKKVWFVTGASKGLGLSLVKQLLKAGNKVAATSRNLNDLTAAVGDITGNFLPLQVDLINTDSVAEGIRNTIANFARIDVVVNNAGYGIGGSIEELSDKETRDSFDVNVFGTLNIIRAVLPYLRAQRAGHIINISSIAGIAPGTGWSIYAATKFAINGLTDVLAEDVREMGIKVTNVAPGAFRTNFLTSESLVMAKKEIPDYACVRASHARYATMNGTQAGDPEKAGEAMIKLVEMENPPVHLLLGSDAYKRALAKTEHLEKEYHKNEELTRSTDY